MELLLEMGVRRSKEFIEKRNIADSGLHGANQALDKTDIDSIQDRDFGAIWRNHFPQRKETKASKLLPPPGSSRTRAYLHRLDKNWLGPAPL